MNIEFKDFNQADIHMFFKYRGTDLYDKKESGGSVRDLSGVKRGKYSKADPDKFLIGKGVSIQFPANAKTYYSSGLIRTDVKEKDSWDEDFDLPVQIHNGYMVFPDFEYYGLFFFILPKYHRPGESTWEYKWMKEEDRYPKPVLTVPRDPKDWKEILEAFTEFLVGLKLFLGSIWNILLIPVKSIKTGMGDRFFGIAEKAISLIPTAGSLIYRKIAAPLLEKKVNIEWNKTLRVNYSPGLLDKILSLADKRYGGTVLIGNIGAHSYFVNLTRGELGTRLRRMFTNPDFLVRNNIDPDRLRCELDYWAKAAREGKDVICYSDTDPLPAVAHEIGHHIENLDGTYGKIQRSSHTILFSDGFVGFVSFLLGWAGPLGEVASWITTFALKSPTLIAEFMASYNGIELMKDAGATEEDLKSAKYSLKLAYSTYLNSVAKKSTLSAYGRIGREVVFRGKSFSDKPKTTEYKKVLTEKTKNGIRGGVKFFKKQIGTAGEEIKTGISNFRYERL